MSTDNNEQSPAKTTKNGAATDDKSKGFCDSQGSTGESEAIVAEPKSATPNTSGTRGGVTIDDRSKGFEV